MAQGRRIADRLSGGRGRGHAGYRGQCLSIAFGNFQAGYLIAERTATSILRDPYTNKPYVHFYAVKRVGGQVVNTDAIKLLKISV